MKEHEYWKVGYGDGVSSDDNFGFIGPGSGGVKDPIGIPTGI